MNHFTTNTAPAQDAALTALAHFVKLRINSALSVEELRSLGRERLEELRAKVPTTVDEFGGYSLNSHFDQSSGSATQGRVGNTSAKSGDEFSGYSLNAHIEEKK